MVSISKLWPVPGIVYALACYVAWGFLPLYFHQLDRFPPLMILSHRILWCVVFLAGYLAQQGRFREFATRLADRKQLAYLTVTSLLIGTNWYLFVYSVSAKRVSEVALAYYLSPLLSALIGTTFLKEVLRAPQYLAIALAFLGVAILAVLKGGVPWLAVTIAASFALYGTIRKVLGIDSLLALWGETLILALPAVLAAWHFTPPGLSAADWGLLTLAGPLTGLPLLWFGQAAIRMRLVTLGLMQFISPTLQFLVAVLVLDEPFQKTHVVAFACIWVAVTLYCASQFATKKTPALGVKFN